MICNSIGVAYSLHWKLISHVDNITNGNDIYIGFYDLCLEVKELDLKDGYENKEEISKLKSTQSQVINNSSNLKGIWNPSHLLGKVLGFHVFPGKEILLIWSNSFNMILLIYKLWIEMICKLQAQAIFWRWFFGT